MQSCVSLSMFTSRVASTFLLNFRAPNGVRIFSLAISHVHSISRLQPFVLRRFGRHVELMASLHHPHLHEPLLVIRRPRVFAGATHTFPHYIGINSDII